MKTVPLGGKKAAGRVALVDDEDFGLVSQYRWHVREQRRPGRNHGPYAQANITKADGRSTTIQMHQLILRWPIVDHANRNGLDNRRENLRRATESQNMANRRPNVRSSSSFKGVCWYARARKWQAYIQVNGRQRCLGYFLAEEDAARAYDAAAISAFGEYALPNFPLA